MRWNSSCQRSVIVTTISHVAIYAGNWLIFAVVAVRVRHIDPKHSAICVMIALVKQFRWAVTSHDRSKSSAMKVSHGHFWPHATQSFSHRQLLHEPLVVLHTKHGLSFGVYWMCIARACSIAAWYSNKSWHTQWQYLLCSWVMSDQTLDRTVAHCHRNTRHKVCLFSC